MEKLKPEDENPQLVNCKGVISTQANCSSTVSLTATIFSISVINSLMYIYKCTHIAVHKCVCMFMCIYQKKLMHDDFVEYLFLYYSFEVCSHT